MCCENVRQFMILHICAQKQKSNEMIWDNSFSMYVNFSKKRTFITPLYVHKGVCIKGVRSVSFLENFAYVLNE